MHIIGELINSTRKRVKKAIEERDEAFIKDLALRQEKAGAGWIDVNAGAFAEDEVEKLTWMIGVIRAVTQAPLSIDSPRPAAVEAGLALAGSGAFLNSISAEASRYKSLLPIIKKHSCNVVALSLDDSGMSDDADKVYAVADGLIKRLEDDGVPPEHIFSDPLIRPVSTNTEYGNTALSVVERIASNHPLVHRICGLSNVSFGLPKRKLVNEVFMVMAIARGMDSAIADPLDERLMAGIAAAELLAGKDQFCMNYIGAERSGKLEGMG
jgi:5-methyltetrahydrofolate corrinoid/iron sulfur protein methyltransferase